MSRESAGAAIRALRESRDWSLADLAAATGVSTMGLSYLERGARKPHKSTVQKVENGLGLPPGTYSRLLVAADPDAELARLIAAQPSNPTAVRRAGAVVVDRHSDTDVLEGYAEAQLDAIKSVIDRLPATTSNEYETYILSVIAQCVKAEIAGRQLLAGGGERRRRLDRPAHGASAGAGSHARRATGADADKLERPVRSGMCAVVVTGGGRGRANRRRRRRNVGYPQSGRHPCGRAPPRPSLRRRNRGKSRRG